MTAPSFPPLLPERPSRAHKAIDVSLTEFCQQPLADCENNNQSLAFITAESEFERKEIRARDVS